MADHVFSIDFGSSFTKVALRRAPGSRAELIRDPSLVLDDELRVCIPSAVVLDRSSGPPVFVWGMKAALNRRAGNGVEVFRNWKKHLFGMSPVPRLVSRPNPRPMPANPLDDFLASAELADLARRQNVPDEDLKRLRRLAAAAAEFAREPEHAPRAAAGTPIYGYLALQFFAELRKFVLAAAAKLGVPSPEAIPCRVAVPAFAVRNGAPVGYGCQVLKAAVEKAGWVLAADDGLISEPRANAIGVLTRGTNMVQPSGKLHIGGMFQYGPFYTTLHDPKYHPDYRVLVADVGAYTTDFGALTLRTGGHFVDDPEKQFEFADASTPVGVSALEDAIVEALPAEKGRWLRTVATASDWQDFHANVTNAQKPFRTDEVGVIGAGPEKHVIHDCVLKFGRELADRAAKFCDRLDPLSFQELILTGGGTAVAAVRDALLGASQRGDWRYRKVHVPNIRGAAGGPGLVVTLDRELTRGGSAVGGASVYFDREFY